ncbi:septum formation inhibitor Maf [Anopheles sinensis]|uniref:Septum formation inhibitor Maf n=1 Tax=Anopheles sinensis TaxID=74873 RepID=A0A084W669_ANOSI|nr:septum formation inhibitor Maf [Anopheles sinensis]
MDGGDHRGHAKPHQPTSPKYAPFRHDGSHDDLWCSFRSFSHPSVRRPIVRSDFRRDSFRTINQAVSLHTPSLLSVGAPLAHSWGLDFCETRFASGLRTSAEKPSLPKKEDAFHLSIRTGLHALTARQTIRPVSGCLSVSFAADITGGRCFKGHKIFIIPTVASRRLPGFFPGFGGI